MSTQPTSLNPPKLLNSYSGTAVLAVLMVMMTAFRNTGVGLLLFSPAFISWLVYSLILIWRKPERRKIQINKMIFWSLLFTALSALHTYYYFGTRVDADMVVFKLLKFRDSYGHYPSDLDEVGISQTQLRDALGNAGYVNKRTNGPFFYYSSTIIVFNVYYFDFDKLTWVYQPA